jgi:putative aminopeptidase FrvX
MAGLCFNNFFIFPCGEDEKLMVYFFIVSPIKTLMQNKELIGQDELQWIEKYIENASPTSREAKGQKLWLDYIRPWVDDHFVDCYGSVAAIINPGKEFKVVIEAHADEIAWTVFRITTDGFIHVQKAGGMDPEIAPGQKVNIHTSSGIVQGIFGWPAIHTRVDSDPKPKNSNIFIDIGCKDKKEVEERGVKVGDFITYASGFCLLNKNFLVGRALDNRIGGFMIAAVARLLKENNIQLPYSLYIVNSVQEEIGLKGAEMMAYTIKPNCAIVTDVCHATRMPMVDVNIEGDIGISDGPAIAQAPCIHHMLRELVLKTAAENKIRFQLQVSDKETGTDADAFAYTSGGIPTALISIPLRYMHTTVETASKKVVEDAIWLIYHTLQKITPGMHFKYL